MVRWTGLYTGATAFTRLLGGYLALEGGLGGFACIALVGDALKIDDGDDRPRDRLGARHGGREEGGSKGRGNEECLHQN